MRLTLLLCLSSAAALHASDFQLHKKIVNPGTSIPFLKNMVSWYPLEKLNTDEETPLIAICSSVSSSLSMPTRVRRIKLLLKAGANVDSIGRDGCTALYRATANDYIAVMRILLIHKANPNYKVRFGFTPLSIASSQEAVDLLVEHSACIRERDDFQHSAEFYIKQQGLRVPKKQKKKKHACGCIIS